MRERTAHVDWQWARRVLEAEFGTASDPRRHCNASTAEININNTTRAQIWRKYWGNWVTHSIGARGGWVAAGKESPLPTRRHSWEASKILDANPKHGSPGKYFIFVWKQCILAQFQNNSTPTRYDADISRETIGGTVLPQDKGLIIKCYII